MGKIMMTQIGLKWYFSISWLFLLPPWKIFLIFRVRPNWRSNFSNRHLFFSTFDHCCDFYNFLQKRFFNVEGSIQRWDCLLILLEDMIDFFEDFSCMNDLMIVEGSLMVFERLKIYIGCKIIERFELLFIDFFEFSILNFFMDRQLILMREIRIR